MQVTLIPRGQARGLTWFIPGEDPTLISKQQIFARIVGALGGRAAEEIIFGDAEVTTGASSDLQQVCTMHLLIFPHLFLPVQCVPALLCAEAHSRLAILQVTNMARQMVVNYGFSDIGPWSLLDPSAQSGDMIMRMMARNGTSESLQRKIDDAVKKIAAEAYEEALTHIRWAALDP